jgi:hypothetical protein
LAHLFLLIEGVGLILLEIKRIVEDHKIGKNVFTPYQMNLLRIIHLQQTNLEQQWQLEQW